MTVYTKRQQQIIDAAIDLISTKGIQQLTIRNLAGSLHISEGALYRHFKSKEEILTGIVDMLNRIQLEAEQRVKTIQGDDWEKITQFFMCCLNKFEKKQSLAAVVFAEEIFIYNSLLSREVYRIMTKTKDITTGLIRMAQQKGVIKKDLDTDAVVMMITGAVRLLVTQWRLSGNNFELLDSGQKLFDNIKKALTSNT